MTIDWTNFSPWSALSGGALIGLAASLLFLANGRIAGISGILGGLLRLDENERPWQSAFISGLLFAPALWAILAPGGLDLPSFTPESAAGRGALIVDGLLVGIGTRLANGCTSGHGVCGLARLSVRSLAAVLVFMAFGFLTVFVFRHVVGTDMAKALVALIAGLIFGFGLIASGMGDPAKVKGFLDLAGSWDPSLALVMVGAIGVAFIPFAWARQRTTSWLGAPMPDNSSQIMDRDLLAGSALFGIGCGLSGFCSGVLGLGAGYQPGIVFVTAMLFGMVPFEWRLRPEQSGTGGDE